MEKVDLEKLLGERRTTEVQVPEWGGSVVLRQLTVQEYAKAVHEYQKHESDSEVVLSLPVFAEILADVIIQPEGSHEQWLSVLQRSPQAVQLLITEAIELSSAKKNSSQTSGSKQHLKSAKR